MRYLVKEVNLSGEDLVVEIFHDKKKAEKFMEGIQSKTMYLASLDEKTSEPNDDIRRLSDKLVA